MMDFLIYEGKVAVVLLVFYLFYRFLLKKETFHRFNRVVLVGTAIISFLLPLCVITIHRPAELETVVMAPEIGTSVDEIPSLVVSSVPWWPMALAILFWTGVAVALMRVVLSIMNVMKIVRHGEVFQEDGCSIVVTEDNVDPFSWMHYIVLSKHDWECDHSSILVHEKAHIRFRHSVELLFVDILSALQWFNPTVWMLRTDLQELHEYEADDAVLRSGIDIKEYQYLLLRKAVSKSGYSVANSFNHSILKNRITMMTKSKSPLTRGLRVLYMIPLVCICIGLQAQTVSDSGTTLDPRDYSNGGSTPVVGVYKAYPSTPLYILRQPSGEEKELTKDEFEKIDQSRISKIEVLQPDVAKEKYGDRAAQGAVVFTMKRPQELDEIVVISYKDEKNGENVPFYLVTTDTMPSFQGEGMQAFSMWLNRRIARPKGCNHAGKMRVSFVVDTDGAVKDIEIEDGICEELDKLVVSLIGQSPRWEPATVNGKPVPQCLTIPITFQMR